MKIALISDIHSNLEALRAVVKSAEEAGAQSYFCLGDIVGYGANPNECIELLSSLDLSGTVLGNHDIASLNGDFSRFGTEHGAHAIRWTVNNLKPTSRAFLEKFMNAPNFYPGLNFAAFHGGPQNPYWQYIFPDRSADEIAGNFSKVDYKTIFVGHSHLQFRFISADKSIYNPGSVGQPRNGDPRAHYMIFDSESKKCMFLTAEYDISAAAEKIKKAGLSLFLAQRLFLGI